MAPVTFVKTEIHVKVVCKANTTRVFGDIIEGRRWSIINTEAKTLLGLRTVSIIEAR